MEDYESDDLRKRAEARERQLAACAAAPKKHKFSTARLAHDYAKQVRHDRGVRLYPYECPCGWWHLTSAARR